jgi:hypothetical protein
VVNDQFNTDGVLPSHWSVYTGPSGDHPTTNCLNPSQVSVSGGYLQLKMQWKTGYCRPSDASTFTGWWSAGLTLNPSQVPMSDAGRVTVRWRVVDNGVVSHRIIPMRWPDGGPSGAGEEDLCESHNATSCYTWPHYGGSNQINHLNSVDLSQWHTWTFEQNTNRELRTWVDGTLVWACTATTTPACNSTTIPAALRRVVLQQQCANATTACPAQSTGTEEIQVDWITVENPT